MASLHQITSHKSRASLSRRVCKAVLETPPGRDCFGVVEVHADRLVVRGVDTFASGEWVVGGGKVVGRMPDRHHQQQPVGAACGGAVAAAVGGARP